MSTKISDSISHLDEILTNKKRPETYTKNVKSRVFLTKSKAGSINDKHGHMRIQSAVAQKSNHRYIDDFDSVGHMDSQELTAGNYIEQHGDESSENASELRYFQDNMK